MVAGGCEYTEVIRIIRLLNVSAEAPRPYSLSACADLKGAALALRYDVL